MVSSKFQHSLLASVLRALENKHLGRLDTVLVKILGLDDILREVLNKHSGGRLVNQVTDEVLSLSLVICILKSMFLYQVREVDVEHIGALSKGSSDRSLARALGSNQPENLRQH